MTQKMTQKMTTKSPDEIKKGLEYCTTTGSCMHCPYGDDCDSNAECSIGIWNGEPAMRDALAYIKQLEAAKDINVPSWISVNAEQKPMHGHKYLCVCSLPDDPKHEWDWMMVLTWYAYGSNGYVDRPHFTDEGVEGMTVTHWMPLPQPPKEE